MRARYLAFFSYIGTTFRSSQKIWLRKGARYADPLSVQGLLELALQTLRPLNYPLVTLSSRTDGGVHALNSSAHFDLERYGTKTYDPTHILYNVNKYLYKNCISISVKECLRVPDNFSARFHAVARTYLYRLAVLKSDVVIPENQTIWPYVPIEEWKRCHFTKAPGFNIELFKEGARHLVGYHDFTTFKQHDQLKSHKHNRREIYSIEVRPGRPLLAALSHASYSSHIASHVSHTTSHMSHTAVAGVALRRRGEEFEYWDIEIKGKAFVHNQIRRMIATLVCVATGKLPVEEIKLMLQIPSKHSWPTFITVTPPDGLYLCDVQYHPDDLIYEPDSEAKASSEPAASDSESNCIVKEL